MGLFDFAQEAYNNATSSVADFVSAPAATISKSPVLGNAVSSVANFVKAPAATISKTIDNAFKNPLVAVVAPVPFLVTTTIEKTTGLTPTTQIVVGGVGLGLGVSAGGASALFGGGVRPPPPTQQAGMLADQEAGLPPSVGTPFVEGPTITRPPIPALEPIISSPADSLASGLRTVKTVLDATRSPTHQPYEASQLPGGTAPLNYGPAQPISPVISFVLAAAATGLLAKALL